MGERSYEKLGARVYTGTLDNGLKVFVDVRPGFRKQLASFAVRYGGMDTRFETGGGWLDTPAGVAHFLEHKLFDTKDGDALQLMSQRGADPNAYTGFDVTAYYFQCTQDFEENLRTLLSFVTDPWFTPESVAKEQGIIGQEIAMEEDDPEAEMFYDMLGCLYAHSPIRTHIAGSAASIAQITDQTLYACHRAFYDPANMALAVVGDVDPERVMAIAREVVTAPGAGAPRRDYGPPEGEEAVRHDCSRQMEVSAPQFTLGFKLPPPSEGEETLRAQLLADLAGDLLLGEASPLYQRLYEAGLVTRNFSGSYTNHPGCAFYAVSGESRDPQAVRAAILAEAERLSREGVDEAAFQRARRAAYGAMVNGLNSFDNTASELLEGYFAGYDYLEFPAVFRTITAGEVGAYLGRWFSAPHAALAVIEPGGEEA